MDEQEQEPLSTGVTLLRETSQQTEATEQSVNAVSEIIQLSTKVDASLSLIVRSFESFSRLEAHKLLEDVDMESAAYSKIKTTCEDMEHTVEGLRAVRTRLESLRSQCDAFEKKAGRVVAYDRISLSRLTENA